LVNGFEVKFFSEYPSYSGFESHPIFVFSTEIVLLACRGRQVSFFTTVGGQTINYQLIWLEAPQVFHLH